MSHHQFGGTEEKFWLSFGDTLHREDSHFVEIPFPACQHQCSLSDWCTVGTKYHWHHALSLEHKEHEEGYDFMVCAGRKEHFHSPNSQLFMHCGKCVGSWIRVWYPSSYTQEYSAWVPQTKTKENESFTFGLIMYYILVLKIRICTELAFFPPQSALWPWLNRST